MKNETKYKGLFLSLIEKLDQDDPIVVALKNFIETYDGTNEPELIKFLIPIIGIINRFEELEIKAMGFDEILKVSSEQKVQMKELKKDFERIQKGEGPLDPFLV